MTRNGTWLILFAAALAATGGVRWRQAGEPPVMTGDSHEYLTMGRSLRVARVLAFEPVAAYAGRAPMYPVFLDVAAGPSGDFSPERARLGQAALAVLLAAGAGALAFCLHSPAAGALAVAVTGFHPDMARAAGWVGVELLFGLCLLAVAWALARDAARRDETSALWAGLAVGVSFWCRSTLLFLPPLLFFLALRESKGGARAWILLLLPYLVIAPWTIRNAARLGAFVPVERQAGVYNLFHASLGELSGVGDEESIAAAEKRVPGWKELDSVQRETALYRFAERNVLAAPFRYALGCLRRAALLWRPHLLLLIACAWALWRLRGREFTALAGLWLYLNIYVLMAIDARYVWPAVPFLCALAACGAADLLTKGAGAEERARRLNRRAGLWLAGPVLLTACCAVAIAVESRAERELRAASPPSPSCPDAESRLGPLHFLADAKRAQDRGVILYLGGDPRAAADCFLAALSLEPRYAAARMGAGTSFVALGDQKSARFHYDAAVRLLEDLGESGDLMLAAYSSRASSLRALGLIKEAREDEASAARLLQE
jgi:tetratricopeptide (TPR) repeat protein